MTDLELDQLRSHRTATLVPAARARASRALGAPAILRAVSKNLVELVRRRVESASGVVLEPELHFVGFEEARAD